MPLTPWAIRLIQWGALTAAELGAAYLETQRDFVPDAFTGRRCVLVFDRTSKNGIDEDVAQIGIALVNYTDGTPDSTWTDADFLAGEANFDALWGAIKPLYPSSTRLVEYRWYRFGKQIVAPNPAVRVIARNVPGTATGDQLPPQCAMSVTFRTALRKHWGRVYLPAPAVTQIADGNWTPAAVDLVADAFEAQLEGLNIADLRPVVWSKLKSAAFGVQEAQVDDLVDIIRSRRFDKPTLRDRRS